MKIHHERLRFTSRRTICRLPNINLWNYNISPTRKTHYPPLCHTHHFIHLYPSSFSLFIPILPQYLVQFIYLYPPSFIINISLLSLALSLFLHYLHQYSAAIAINLRPLHIVSVNLYPSLFHPFLSPFFAFSISHLLLYL